MTFEEALAEAKRAGISRCSDPALMASFCQADIQLLVGTASPKLVWAGAMSRGLTSLQLAQLCATDPKAVADLIWEEEA